jgi:OPA family glycerol-3-phosphate transporter-like MFS transporter
VSVILEKEASKSRWPELDGLGLTFEQKVQYDKFRFWRVVIAGSFFYCFYYLGRLNWGICMPWIIEDLGISKAEAGIAATVLLWAYAVGTFLSGRLGEIFGQRRLCLIGGVGSTILNIIVALQSTMTGILIPWAANGFIQGQTYAPINSMISNWYPKARRGVATGIFATSMGLSTIVAWAVTGTAVAYFGWRWAFTWPLIGLMLPMTIFFYLVSRNKPEEAGFPPYEETSGGISVKAEEFARDKTKTKGIGPYLYLYSNWKFTLMCIASFSCYVGRYGLLTWVPLFYAETAGISLKQIPIMTFALPIGMAIGPVIGGWMSDKVFGSKRWQMIVIFSILSAVTLLIMGLIPIQTMGLPMAIVLQVFAGILVLGMNGVLFTAACDFGGRIMAGTAVGSINLFNYFGAGFQGVLIGGILQSTGSWMAVWVLCACLLATGAVAMVIVRE